MPKRELMPGSTITLHFSLALADGTEAFNTGDEPLSCTLGDGTLLPGLELALYGLKAGDEQTLTLTPQQAWGDRNPELIKELPRTDFPADTALEAGQVLAFSLPKGEETTGSVLGLKDEQVLVDFNHPLCGQEVVFQAHVLEVDNSGIADD